MMKVQDVMSMSAVTCTAEEPLHAVAQKMWDHDCGCVPVVDREGRALAMITDRDICMAALTTGKALAELRVAGSMSKQVVSCLPQEDLQAAAQRMGKHGVRRLPVVDGTGKLVGILSLNDLAAAIAEGSPPALTNNVAAAQALRVLEAVSRHRSAVPSRTTPAPAPAASPPVAPAPKPATVVGKAATA